MNNSSLEAMLKAKGYNEKKGELTRRRIGETPANPEKMYEKDDVVIFVMSPGRFHKSTYKVTVGRNEEPVFYPFFDAAEKCKDKKFFFLAGADSGDDVKYAPLKDYFLAMEFFNIEEISNVTSTMCFSYGNEILSENRVKELLDVDPKPDCLPIDIGERGNFRNIKVLLIREDLFDKYILFADSRTYKDTIDITKYVFDSSAQKKPLPKTIPHNLLIYGAPGTGKSCFIDKCFREKLIPGLKDDESKKKLMEDIQKKKGEKIPENIDLEATFKKEYMTRVTFYEDYSYENFVGCYKPVKKADEKTGEEKLTYEFEPGPFINIYVKAVKDEAHNYLLAIEEINRAKAAAVFGDLFQVLDRDDNGNSEYSVKPETALDKYLEETLDNYDGTISLPSNLYIWATMNSADQDVYVLDSAFKRRWQFKYMDINAEYGGENDERNIHLITEKGKKAKSYTWDSFRKAINNKLKEKYEEDRWIGSWFFKNSELKMINDYMDAENRTNMVNPLADKLLTYLLQDVVKLSKGDLFKNDYQNISAVRAALASDTLIYDIINIEPDKLVPSKEENSDSSDDKQNKTQNGDTKDAAAENNVTGNQETDNNGESGDSR